MKLSRISVVALAAAAVLGLVAGPARAASGIGTVNGQVTTSPGISTTPNHQTIGFSSIIITGTFVSDDGSQQFAGTITVSNVSAQTTGAEDTTMGTGTINYFTWAGSGAPANVSGGTCGTSGVTGSAGGYTRVGGVVLVTLHCQATIGGKTFKGEVLLESLYIPTTGNGVTQAVTAASFDGVYEVESAVSV